jgi:hypothetical protein
MSAPSARRALLRGPVLAGAALVASAGVFARAAVRAIAGEPLPQPRAEASMGRRPGIVQRAATAPALVVAAIESDPFHPDRRRPTIAFRFPGEARSDVAATPASVPREAMRLIGTVVQSAGKGFAMCQLGNEPPRILRVGERVGELTLKQVEQGRAVFLASDGSRVEVQAPKAGS